VTFYKADKQWSVYNNSRRHKLDLTETASYETLLQRLSMLAITDLSRTVIWGGNAPLIIFSQLLQPPLGSANKSLTLITNGRKRRCPCLMSLSRTTFHRNTICRKYTRACMVMELQNYKLLIIIQIVVIIMNVW